MASQLQQKLAAFRNNQMKLQTKAAEEVRRKAAAAERAKLRKATEPKAKPDAKPKPSARRTAALGKRLKDLLEWLREARAPKSAAEIQEATAIDVEGDAAMVDAVKANLKIESTPDGLYEYKTLMEIRDADALLSALRAKGESGLIQSDVDDSYPGAKADIERLRVQKKLYAVHNHDLRELVLYSRDDKLDKEAEYVPELADVWRSIEIPVDPVELQLELSKAGIVATLRSTNRKRTVLPKKERKKRQQKVRLDKVTNAHMPELFSGAAPQNIDE